MGNSGSGARDSNDLSLELPAVERPPLADYYTVVLALAQGSKENQRPGLPPELVILICRFSNFHHFSPKYVIKETKRVKTSANSADEASKTWMQSPPMTAQTISHVQSFQLFTDSHHQGWVSDPSAGSWSWFEIGLCRLDESSGQITPKTMSDGSPAFWESHRHPVEESEDAFEIEEDLSDEDLDQDIHEEDEEDEIQEEIQFDTQSLTLSDDDNVSATFFTDLNEGGIDGQGDDDDNEDMDEGFSDQDIPNENLMGVGEVGLDDEDLEVDFGGYKLHNGSQFGPEHPIWDHVEEGDVLVVQLKAQFGGWANYARRGVIRANTWWEPSAAMLNLVYNR